MIRLSAFADEASASVEGQITALHRNKISYIEIRALDGVNVSKVSEEDAKNTQLVLKKKTFEYGL